MTTGYQASGDAMLALAELYDRHRAMILARLIRVVRDADVAEDLCQETFIKALRSWGTRDPSGNVAAWLSRIAINTAYDFLRRRRRYHFVELSADQPAPSVAAEHTPVYDTLAQLPEHYRQLLVLHACEGHSLDELAVALGCSSAAVKSRLFRARASFRQLYPGHQSYQSE